MTSKEMEARSGVPRANIRYYEAEGLLHPERLKNGYRSYSEEDLRTLEKIKLLRRLGVSVDKPVELVEIHAAIVDIDSDFSRELGVNWSGAGRRWRPCWTGGWQR